MACFKFKFVEAGFEHQGTTDLEVDDYMDETEKQSVEVQVGLLTKVDSKDAQPDAEKARVDLAPEEGGEVGA